MIEMEVWFHEIEYISDSQTVRVKSSLIALINVPLLYHTLLKPPNQLVPSIMFNLLP